MNFLFYSGLVEEVTADAPLQLDLVQGLLAEGEACLLFVCPSQETPCC